MKAEIARRIENLLVLIAALLVIGGLYSWAYRVACIFGAIGVLLLIATLRFKARAGKRQVTRTSNVFAAVARIRAARRDRFARPADRRREPLRDRLGR